MPIGPNRVYTLGVMRLKAIKQIDVKAQPMVRETSYARDDIGTHASTMELWWNTTEGEKPDFYHGSGLIEWDIPTLETTEQIGIWTEDGKLCDYDGIMGYPPKEAYDLLRSVGIRVPMEYSNPNLYEARSELKASRAKFGMRYFGWNIKAKVMIVDGVKREVFDAQKDGVDGASIQMSSSIKIVKETIDAFERLARKAV